MRPMMQEMRQVTVMDQTGMLVRLSTWGLLEIVTNERIFKAYP